MSTHSNSFRAFVRKFASAEIAPLASRIDRENEFPCEIWRNLGQARLLGISAPKAYGGAERGYLAHVIAMEEISRASASVGLSFAAHSNLCLDNLAKHGNTSQCQRYLPKLCSGELIGALAMSEPGAGSDVVGSMACRAEKHGKIWVANGTKKWITNGPDADLLLVYMRTAPREAGAHSITAFIIEKGMPGFHTGKKTDKLGMRGSNTCELHFKDCNIPQDNVLGEANRGTEIMMAGLDTERMVLAGGPLGIMQAAMDIVLPFARKRIQFNQPIGAFELIGAKLADMYTQLQAARAFVYRVAEGFDRGEPSRKDAAACLMFSSESAVRVALESIQTLGARGYMNDSPTGRLLRDAKLYDIGGGTNEIRRVLIGRELFKDDIPVGRQP